MTSRKLATTLLITIIAIVLLTAILYHNSIISYGSKTVRFAVELNDHSAAFWVALDKGWFEDAGINIDYKVFSTGLELAAAMTKGDIDVALACVGPLLMVKAKGVPIKLVAMTHLHGYAIVANPKYTDITQLNGKIVSATGPGSPTWLLAKLVEDNYNVSFDLKRMPPFVAVGAVVSGKVDAAFIPEHYVTLAKTMGAKVLIRSQEIWPSMPGSGVAVTEEFLRDHRDIVVKIVEILTKAVKYIKEHPDDAAKIVAKHLASDTSIMRESMKYLDYTTSINLEEITRYINYLRDYGVLESNITVEDFVDTSILGEIDK